MAASTHMNVIPIPVSASIAARAIDRFTHGNNGPANLHEIAQRLGMIDLARRTIIEQVRALNLRYGFPDPANPRFEKGRLISGPRAITVRSLWSRGAVEAWFGGRHAPSNAALVDPLSKHQTRNALAGRAANLVGKAA
jgi:hypothetical protein